MRRKIFSCRAIFPLLVTFFALAFASCNFFNSNDDEAIQNEIIVTVAAGTSGADTASRTAYLSVSVKDENGNALSDGGTSQAARTALPTVSTAGEFNSFTLSGSKDGGFEWQTLWASDGSSTTSALTQLNAASIPVSEGLWTFKLIAQKGGVIYTGQITRQEIVAGASERPFFYAQTFKNRRGRGELDGWRKNQRGVPRKRRYEGDGGGVRA